MTMEKTSGSFSVTVAPIPGESLNGYMMRVADRYLIGTVTELLAACGNRPPTLRHLHIDDGAIENVALRLGVSISELQKRRYQAQVGLQNTIWFGPHRIDREVYVGQSPRIAPHTFRSAGYHKMVWDLHFVVADPDTGERLIDACPHCGKSFSWTNSNFLTCHKCGEFLAHSAADVVDQDTQTAIRGLSGLVSSFPEEVRLAEADLAPEIRMLGPEKLFQFVFSLAAGIDQEEALRRPKTELGRLKETKKPGRRTAHLDWEKAVVRGYQVATSWPEALLGYLREKALISEQRAGAYGTKKALGYFQTLLREWNGDAEIWAVVIPAIREFLQSHPEIVLKSGSRLSEEVGAAAAEITINEIKCRYQWSYRRIARLLELPGFLLSGSRGSGTPLRIDRTKVEGFMDSLKELTSQRGIRAAWGVPHAVIAELAEDGIFAPADAVYLHLVGNVRALYRRSQVDAVFETLTANPDTRVRSPNPVTMKPIIEILQGRSSKPWAMLVRGVLAGEIKPAKIDRTAHNALDRLLFDRDTAHRWAHGTLKIENPTVSYQQAAQRLDVDASVIAILTQEEILPTCPDLHGGRAMRIYEKGLKVFEERYVSQSVLAKLYQGHMSLITGSCRHFKIEPLQLKDMRTRFYPRDQFPKNFRILSRKELTDLGILKNGLTFGAADKAAKPSFFGRKRA